jgi:hypothetical protein
MATKVHPNLRQSILLQTKSIRYDFQEFEHSKEQIVSNYKKK